MIARILAIVVVLVLIVATVILGRGGRAPDRLAPTDDEESDETGYAAHDAEVVETGADGRPLYRLRAKRIEQNAADRQVALEQLTVDYRTAGGALWQLRADRGRLPEDARVIDVEGDVRLTGPIEGSTAPLQVDTDRMTLDTQGERVTTTAPVTLAWSDQRLRSTGLVANLKDERVRLESQVHGRFLP